MANLIEDLIQGLTPSQNSKSESLSNDSYHIIEMLSQGYFQNENSFVPNGVQILNNENIITIRFYDHGEEIFDSFELIQNDSFVMIKPKSVIVNYKFPYYQIILNEYDSLILKYDMESEEWYLYEIHSL